MKSKTPIIIQGNIFSDMRGSLTYANNFYMDKIKRFYYITHPDITIIRAWQGHKKEQKWFFVLQGSFHFFVIEPDNWETPSSSLKPLNFFLSESTPQILHIPGGYATGFKAREKDSKLMVFSSMTVNDSKDDDYRFPLENWVNWKSL